MSKTITENGKQYVVDNGHVTEVRGTQEISINDRVSFKTKLGTVVTSGESVYGPYLGVKFDDGTFEGLEANDLEKVDMPAPTFENPVDEIRSEYEEYERLGAGTLEEIETKKRVARSLNLRARSLKSARETPFTEQLLLDGVATATSVDILDLERAKDHMLNFEEDSHYLSELPKFEVSETVYRSGKSSDGDASWLELVAKETENEVDDTDWDAHVAAIATEFVDSLDESELSDSVSLSRALDNHINYYQIVDAEKRAALESFVAEAVRTRVSKVKTKKVAAVKEEPYFNLKEYDASELFA